MNKKFLTLAILTTLAASSVYVDAAGRKHKTSRSGDEQKPTHQEKMSKKQLIQTTSHKDLRQVITLCLQGQFNAAEDLIESKQLDIDAHIDDEGNYVLHGAITGSTCIINRIFLYETIVFLMAQGANPNHRNKNGQTILHIMCNCTFIDQDYPTLDLITECLRKSRIDAIDAFGRHALHYACNNNVDLAVYLLNNNIGQEFIALKDVTNKTPVTVALKHANYRKIIDAITTGSRTTHTTEQASPAPEAQEVYPFLQIHKALQTQKLTAPK